MFFFAVKKNVSEIKRENFPIPERQDEYGTSVISIQFTRGSINTLSIKNRYNHTVNNPDATFSNNLENIIPGLTESFRKKYNLNVNREQIEDFELPNYVRANDGKFYKYNHEINNIYYCPNNIIIDNYEVKKYDKEKYIVLDYFILDLRNKTIEQYDKCWKDDFVEGIKNILKINVTKLNENVDRRIELLSHTLKRIIIELDKRNQIIGYKNEDLTIIRNDFLRYNEYLEYIYLPKLVSVGCNFLCFNKKLENLNLPNLTLVSWRFLDSNLGLKSLDLSKLRTIGKKFLSSNYNIKDINSKYLDDFSKSILNERKELMKGVSHKK